MIRHDESDVRFLSGCGLAEADPTGQAIAIKIRRELQALAGREVQPLDRLQTDDIFGEFDSLDVIQFCISFSRVLGAELKECDFAVLTDPVAADMPVRDLIAMLLSHRCRCPHCGYDLRGLPPESKCPECGSKALWKGGG